jgi:glutathione S-transferase
MEFPMSTLYGVFRSRASRPIWLLYELDEAFEHVPVIQAYRLKDAKAADAPFNTASPAFLKVNPIGQIPAWVEGDLVLTESLAITNHIARTRGGPLGPGPLPRPRIWTSGPSLPSPRSKARRWRSRPSPARAATRPPRARPPSRSAPPSCAARSPGWKRILQAAPTFSATASPWPT